MNSIKYLPLVIDESISIVVLSSVMPKEFLKCVNDNRDYLLKSGSRPWLEKFKSEEDVLKYYYFIDKKIDEKEKMNLALLYNGAFAGEIKFHEFDWEQKVAEIGYWLGKEFHGKGLVCRSLDKMIKLLHQQGQISFFEAQTDQENKKSQNVLLRLNFVNRPIKDGTHLMDRHQGKRIVLPIEDIKNNLGYFGCLCSYC